MDCFSDEILEEINKGEVIFDQGIVYTLFMPRPTKKIRLKDLIDTFCKLEFKTLTLHDIGLL
jgi:hypothetical protein